jgi:hypothetical protein
VALVMGDTGIAASDVGTTSAEKGIASAVEGIAVAASSVGRVVAHGESLGGGPPEVEADSDLEQNDWLLRRRRQWTPNYRQLSFGFSG